MSRAADWLAHDASAEQKKHHVTLARFMANVKPQDFLTWLLEMGDKPINDSNADRCSTCPLALFAKEKTQIPDELRVSYTYIGLRVRGRDDYDAYSRYSSMRLHPWMREAINIADKPWLFVNADARTASELYEQLLSSDKFVELM